MCPIMGFPHISHAATFQLTGASEIYYFYSDINSFTSFIVITVVYLRNKSWKPECVGSFNMDWRISVFYPEPETRDKIY